jgi:hypothetical protein
MANKSKSGLDKRMDDFVFEVVKPAKSSTKKEEKK